jgi:hypothetical protein
MTFKTDGFLSPTMEQFRTSLREVPAYKLWLEFAEELNRLGWDMLEDHETPTTEAHLRYQRKTARIVLNTPEYRSGCTAAEIAQMETTIKDITDKEVVRAWMKYGMTTAQVAQLYGVSVSEVERILGKA